MLGLGSLAALLGGKAAIASIFGGGAVSAGAALLNGKWRKPLLILGAVLAIVALTLVAVAWHAHRKAAFGREQFAAGEAKVQAAQGRPGAIFSMYLEDDSCKRQWMSAFGQVRIKRELA